MIWTRHHWHSRPWHRWFAWYPVRVQVEGDGSVTIHTWAWLTIVERKGQSHMGYWCNQFRLALPPAAPHE